jgi:excisionase family DNA binding protein
VAAVEEVTVQEAARRVNRSPETIRRWIWSGRLPATKRGNKYYVDVMRLREVVMEIAGTTWHSPEPDIGHDMAAWLDKIDRWTAGLRAAGNRIGQRKTSSDLVIEDRRERR